MMRNHSQSDTIFTQPMRYALLAHQGEAMKSGGVAYLDTESRGSDGFITNVECRVHADTGLDKNHLLPVRLCEG